MVKNQNTKLGFSLIELAMVIIIMGLLASAIVGGKQLIRSAKLNGIIQEAKDYKAQYVLRYTNNDFNLDLEEYTINLNAYNKNEKINTIKAVKNATGLGLVDSKNLVDNVPITFKVSKANYKTLCDSLKSAKASFSTNFPLKTSFKNAEWYYCQNCSRNDGFKNIDLLIFSRVSTDEDFITAKEAKNIMEKYDDTSPFSGDIGVYKCVGKTTDDACWEYLESNPKQLVELFFKLDANSE